MKRTVAIALSALMFAVLVLTSCQAPPAAAQTTAPAVVATATPETTPEATPSPTPAQPKILRYGVSSLAGKFNPILADAVYDSYMVSLMYSNLVSNDNKGNFIFSADTVADSCDLSDDHLTYTFHLKKGIKFTDGTDLTADDVKYTFMMIANKDYTGPRGTAVQNIAGYDEYAAGAATDITGIKIVDDYTISFTITAPNVANMVNFSYGILSKDYYDKPTFAEFEALNAAPVGCGPFKFESFTPGQSCILVANPDYFGTKPKIDGVTALMIPEETQVQALITDQVDIINPAANKDNNDTMTGGGANVIRFTGLGYNALMMNLKDPIMSDVKVRQALLYGFDRKSFIDNEYEGFASPALAPISPASWAYPKDTSVLNTYDYNPDKAAQLLDEAGWVKGSDGIREKDGKKLSFTIYIYNDTPWPEHIVALLTEQWGALGIELKSMVADFDTVMTLYDNRDFSKFSMWTQGWQDSIDPDPTELFSTSSFENPTGFNASGYSNAEADKIFEDARAEYDQAKRADLYAQWCKIANEELPMLFNAFRDQIWGVSAAVTGFDKMSPFYDWTYCIFDVDINR